MQAEAVPPDHRRGAADTVLVTGGTGFIARWCIARLLEQGVAVHTTVRAEGREGDVRTALAEAVDLGDRLTVVVADLTADLLRGEMPRIPKIGLEVVDVRDVADIHVFAMTAADARNQRFLATGELMWMTDIARMLRDELGPDAARVPNKSVPDAMVRLMARRQPELRGVLPGLGRRNRHTTAKAEQLLGWRPRPGADAVVDCARSLVEHGVA